MVLLREVRCLEEKDDGITKGRAQSSQQVCLFCFVLECAVVLWYDLNDLVKIVCVSE